MSERWQVKSRENVLGPYTMEQLRKLADAGRLKRNTPVRADGHTMWLLAETVAGLFEAGDLASVSGENRLHPDESAFLLSESASSSRHDDPVRQPIVPPVVQVARPKRTPRLLAEEPRSWWDLFDWRFERYLTPWIIRGTWMLILWLAFCGLTWQAVDSGYAIVFNSTISADWRAREAKRPPVVRPPGNQNHQPGLALEPERLGETRLNAIGWMIATAVGTLLTLLYTRVFFEFLIVQFNIAGSLQRFMPPEERDD